MRQSLEWQSDGLCAQTDPDVFYPEHGDKHAAQVAKRVCAECPVIKKCLTSALRWNEPYGIWGGMSPKERQELRKINALTA